MLHIIILDDDPRIGSQLIKELRVINEALSAEAFTSWKELSAYLCRQPHVDAVFMDLQFDSSASSGIDYAEKILETHSNTKIIYITGYPLDYIQKVFLSKSVKPSGFITKPFQREVLKEHIARLMNEQLPEEEMLAFKTTGSGVNYIPLADILYLSSRKRCVTVYTKSGAYTGYYKLSELLPKLPKYFYQCHKSYIVNLRRIQRIEAKHVFAGSTEIPLSAIGTTTIAEKRMEIVRIKSALHEQEVK